MLEIVITAAAVSALAAFLYWSDKSIVITGYEHVSSKLPKSFDGMRVTQVSDLQSQRFGRGQQNLIEAVSETEPDVIVFTGDLVDRNHTDYELGIKTMKQLRNIAPLYYVNGNHELGLPEEEMARVYETLSREGTEVLFDRCVKIEKGSDVVNIAGLSEYVIFEAMEDGEAVISKRAAMLTAQLDREDMTIMITHEPQYFEQYAHSGADIIFAGHAHGGQIRIPFFNQGLFSPGQGVLPKLTAGVHKKGEATMIISRGLGNSIFPFRVFNRPEVVSVTMKCK